jgi:hypothetical protein
VREAAYWHRFWADAVRPVCVRGVPIRQSQRTDPFPIARNLDCFRPVTALACSGIDDGYGRSLTQPLNPAKPGRFSRSDNWALNWDRRTFGGDRPANSGRCAYSVSPNTISTARREEDACRKRISLSSRRELCYLSFIAAQDG